jgi:hypothetical protein
MWPFATSSNATARRTAARSCRYRPTLETLENRLCPSGLSSPTIVSAVAVSPTQATLTWTDVANEAGFRILLWNGTTGVPVATVGAGVTKTTVTGLPAGQAVYFAVEAFNGAETGDSAWTAALQLPSESLTAASGLKAVAVSPTEVDLTWTAAQGQNGYQIYEYDGSKDVLVATLGASAISYPVTGLTPATPYYFSVQAFNDMSSVPTDWVSATTERQPLAAPAHLTLTPGKTQVALSWTAASGATGYNIFEWVNGTTTQIATTNASTTTYTATGLHTNTAYWFYVEAYNPSNVATTNWEVVTTTASSSPLLPPTNVTAQSLGNGKVALNWTGAHGAAGYWIYRFTGAHWIVVGHLGANARSVTETGLTVGTSQDFLVMAYTSGGAFAGSAVMVTV